MSANLNPLSVGTVPIDFQTDSFAGELDFTAITTPIKMTYPPLIKAVIVLGVVEDILANFVWYCPQSATLAAPEISFGGIAPSPQNFESFPQARSNSLGIFVVVHTSVSFG
jgi:hypothetical protein